MTFAHLAAVALGTLIASLASAAPIPSIKANYEPPTATFHAASGQRILLDVAMYCQGVFGKQINEQFAELTKQAIAEKRFGGFDLSRPAGAYVYLRPKMAESVCVLVVPVTSEKGALESFASGGFDVAKEDKARGLYTLHELKLSPWSPLGFLNGVTPVVRFHEQHAYIALHAGESDVLNNADKLVPITALVNDKEPAQIAGTFHFDRFPKVLQDPLIGLLREGQEGVAMMQQRAPQGMPKGFPNCAQQVLTWCQRNLPVMFTDAETLNAKFTLDAKAGDHDLELILVPKAKTPLAADLLGVKKANGRFAQLLNKEAVTGISMTLPGPIPEEIRRTAGVFLSEWINLEFSQVFGGLGIDGPLGDMVNKQVAAGQVDLAGAVYGPDKDGVYTALAAVGVADAAGMETALKAAMKDAPKEVADLIKWEAVKIGEAKAHTVAVVDKMPDEFKRSFGEKNLLHVAFTKDAAYLAIGPEAVGRIEKSMALKAADCVGFNMVIHREKFMPLADAFGGRMKLSLEPKDELLPVYRADVFGGDGLHVKFHMGLVPFLLGRAVAR